MSTGKQKGTEKGSCAKGGQRWKLARMCAGWGKLFGWVEGDSEEEW